MTSPARPGWVVAWWDGNALALGVVAGEEKNRLRLVLGRGREVRVSPARIACEVEGPGVIPGKDLEQRRLAGARVDQATERLAALTSGVDVPLVWEIVVDDREGEILSVVELAELALESVSGESRTALMRALLEDGVHFVRKGEGWQPRPRAAVEELQAERRIVERRARETGEFLEALRQSENGSFEAAGGEVERRFLEALERFAIEGEAADVPTRNVALEALEASGLRYDRPHEGAFQLLRRLGRFSADDQNLQVLRFDLRTEFPQPVLAQAEECARRGFDRTGRRDLTALDLVSIDGQQTREIDDALSIEGLPGGGERIGIHIADPAAFIEPGGVLDSEALARSLTHYMPDLRLPMLPPVISEEAASLVAEQERPALSFLVELDEDGEMLRYEIVRSIVRCRAGLAYEEADRIVEQGDGPFAGLLRDLVAMAERREQARARAGAVLIHAPEAEVHVGEDGEVVLERLSPDSPSRKAVSEAMVLAGAVAAIFAREQGLSLIHRRQGAPRTPASIAVDAPTDPVSVRRLRMTLRPADAGLEPGRHHSLGLEAYAQVTSPIRRYQDLAAHRQIVAALDGRPAFYDVEAMQRVLATTERAALDARRAEREADSYWMLRYLGSQSGAELEACVVQVEPRPVVQLTETLWEQPMPSLAGHATLGEIVLVRVERVNPRAGLLTLRRV